MSLTSNIPDPNGTTSVSHGSNKSLRFNKRAAFIFITEAALLSCTSVLAVLIHIAVKTLRSRSLGRNSRRMKDIHHYFVNLMVFDLVQATGGALSIKWTMEGTVMEDTGLCTAQAVLKQIGNNGVALTSLAIALHTFYVLALRWQPPATISYVVICLIWLFIFLVVIIGWSVHRNGGSLYYGDTGYWCWITKDYKTERIVLEYVWLWSAAFINIIIYFFLALVFGGFVALEAGRLRFRTISERRQDRAQASGEAGREARKMAKSLLFYPLVYIITILPNSISRWSAFSNPSSERPPSEVAGTNSLFQLSGFLNVVLFVITRPKIVGRGGQETDSLNEEKEPDRVTGGWPQQEQAPRFSHELHIEYDWAGRRLQSESSRLKDFESETGFAGFDDQRTTPSTRPY